MATLVDQILRNTAVSVGLSKSMLKDIKPQLFARKPATGTTVVDTNHPAFVYGHLSLYPAKVMQMLGKDPAATSVPPAYAELFEAGKPCHDDSAGQIYPPMEEITGHYFRAYDALVDALKAVPDEALYVPNPREGRMKEMFPDLAGMVVFMLTSHIMMHLGQVSAWRRFHGLGPVM